jgi:hypothetical protein
MHQQASTELASTKASLAKSEEARVRAEVRTAENAHPGQAAEPGWQLRPPSLPGRMPPLDAAERPCGAKRARARAFPRRLCLPPRDASPRSRCCRAS